MMTRKGSDMKQTMLYVNKAKSLLRAMAELSGGKAGVDVSPDEASLKHALGLSGDELRDIEGYLATQGWIGAAAGAGGVRALTEAGLVVANKVRP